MKREKFVAAFTEIEINWSVTEMFVATADNNYILSRAAYFSGAYLDFLWLSLHSIEKYLKSILLFNKYRANKYSHNIVTLHDAVCKIDRRVIIPPFDLLPKKSKHRQDLVNEKESVRDFLNRLMIDGGANNRYMVSGFDTGFEDLLKVDHIVWEIRRLCRPWKVTRRDDSGDIQKIDVLEELLLDRKRWEVHFKLPIETVLAKEENEIARLSLIRWNYRFGKGRIFGSRVLYTKHYATLTRLIERLSNSDPHSDISEVAAESLEWLLEHVYFGTHDRAKITVQLESWRARRNATRASNQQSRQTE